LLPIIRLDGRGFVGGYSVGELVRLQLVVFLLQLPDVDFVLAGSFRLSINEARSFGRFKLMMPVMDTDTGGLQGPDISVLCFF